ncbi:Ribosome biogenesis protein erb1 [Coemansia erecta]|uniref:Ribosome biogenesis protein ERB1 n=1 Tax=Coemansia erecta TaxID=147472 RepID=A0A9W7Y6B9_9FUNG|nr:Ribosome biogenesis protein erb1 [Coemansia erecta]
MAAGKGNKKRSAAHRDAEAKTAAAKSSSTGDEFPTAMGSIDVSSESEYASDADSDSDLIEGSEQNFEDVLKAMAADQGFEVGGSSSGEDDEEEGEEGSDGEESDIHSSDIDGASSEGEEADSEDAEGSDSDGEGDGGLLRRTGSRSTDGQATAVDSDSDGAASDTSQINDDDMRKLTIRDFGADLASWKAYRQTLPQIDAGYASDSSTEDTPNTIGNVPIAWYEDYPHIGYTVDGQRVMRPATGDELDKFLENMDNPDVFRTARDEANQRDVTVSAEEIDIIRRIQGGDIPDAAYDAYAPTVEWFTSQTMKTPVTGAPLTKRGFVPSKWEHKRVMQIVRAIRSGAITAPPARDQQQQPRLYDVWEHAEAEPGERRGRPRMVAPRLALPTHEESYHPPEEYLPTAEQRAEWEATDAEDRRRAFLPQDFGALRNVPGYERFVDERFGRCLDLYLAPRMLRKKSALNADELMPRLPDPRDLRPFPAAEALAYVGHSGRVRSISVDPTGLWLLSGSDDGSVRLWEVVTGRCARVWTLGGTVHAVAWCPNADVCVFAAAVGSRVVVVVPPELCDGQRRTVSEDLVRAGFASAAAEDAAAADDSLPVSWDVPPTAEQTAGVHVSIAMHRTVKALAWHRRGDYLATLTAEEGGGAVLMHQLSKHKSQRPFRSLKGAVQSIRFHPTRPWFLVATQRYVRIYNLMQQALVKTLQPGVKWISSVDVHPQGDNVVVGSYDKKLSWFDLDLSVKPYRSIRYHRQAIRQVCFSRKFPLFATASDDGSIQVYHGMVYQDLNQNPLIVPLKILRGHEIRNSLGVLDCVFHPIQPWLLSSGADGTIRLWT